MLDLELGMWYELGLLRVPVVFIVIRGVQIIGTADIGCFCSILAVFVQYRYRINTDITTDIITAGDGWLEFNY